MTTNFILERKSTVEDAVEYSRKVAEGELIAGEYVIKQAQKFLNDVEKRQYNKDFRWKFDVKKAGHVLAYIQALNFVEGPVAGSNIILQPWQAFLMVNLYGWIDKNDSDIRRYTRAITLVARKAGKSTILGALALYELMFAPEGSQIVTLATRKEQAKLVFGMSGRMKDVSDPILTKDVKETTNNLSNLAKWNRYVPLSKDSKRLDGLNIRLAVADESAAITDPNLINVVTSSMGNQKSPLIVHLTTGQPGNENSFFLGQLDYAKKVLDGILEDERIFCLAYQIDSGDDWQDLRNVIKAQPNLGVSVKKDFYQEELEQAKSITTVAANYRTKYLNEFIETNESWIPIEKWKKNAVEKINRNLPLYIGLDLGATKDLSSVAMVFGPDTNGKFYVDHQCFIPEKAFKEAAKYVRQVYADARDSGKLIVTEGEVADHAAIRDFIHKIASKYQVEEICFDDWSAITLTNQLAEDGFTMVDVQQSMKALSPTTKEVEIKILNGELISEKDEFLNWMVSNCRIFVDTNENVKVRKGEDVNLKIDSVIAIIMAMVRANLNEPKPNYGFYFGEDDIETETETETGTTEYEFY
ncbi:terminase large subunit [Neptunicoccus sediminis]|uniref:terminase large subunit n=1 Tax=Neptunicoccus sediminis TaxID=1892596 RepID=UPI000845FC33|nr:terminase TerL endonuclease subunit [Neptunicoccus sediminis]